MNSGTSGWFFRAAPLAAMGFLAACSPDVPNDVAAIPVAGFRHGQPIRGLLMTDSALFIGRDGDGTVERHEARTGEVRWSVRLPNWVHSAPVIAGDKLVATYGDNFPVVDSTGKNRMIVGRGDGGIVALRHTDGTIVWRYESRGAVMTRALVIGDTVLAVTGDRRLLALDAATGRDLWHVDAGGIGSMASPLIVGRSVIVGLSDPQSIAAFDLDTHRLRWRALIGERVRGTGDVTPAIVGDTLISTSTQLVGGNEFLSLDVIPFWPRKVLMRIGVIPWRPLARQWSVGVSLSDGRVLWSTSLGVGFHRELNRSGTPEATPDGVVFSSYITNEVIRLSASGRVLWRTRTPGDAAKGNVLVVGDSVAVALSDGRLTFLQLRDGRVTSSRASAGRIGFFAPLLCDGRLTYPTEEGILVSLPVDDTSRSSYHCPGAPR